MIRIKNTFKSLALLTLFTLGLGINQAYCAAIPPQSAQRVTVETPNYCRNIIEALKGNNTKEALMLIGEFYTKIPTELKNITIQRQTNNDRIAASKKINLSIFYLMALCIAHGAQNLEKFDLTKAPIGYKNQTISLCLQTTNKIVYEIKFETNDEIENNEISNKITITQKTFLRITRASREKIINIEAGYNTDNFFKNIVMQLTKGITSIPFIFSSTVGGNTTPAQKLSDIFNAIPSNLRDNHERYFQTLVYTLANFMGSNICHSEYHTGKGRADLILQTKENDNAPIIFTVIEFKFGKTSASEALEQIRRQQYANCFNSEINAIGINIKAANESNKILVDVQSETQNIDLPKIEQNDAAASFSVNLKSYVTLKKPNKRDPDDDLDDDQNRRKRQK